MENIKITLETLYDILRNEKKKEDLQKLEDSFFIDVIGYLREKRFLLEQKNEEEELFAAGEREKVEYELRSIKRILKEIYEKREKKIIDIALNKSRTGSDIIDTSAMLREEKEFYKNFLKTLDFYRRGVLLNLFKGELPDISEGEVKRANVEIRDRKKYDYHIGSQISSQADEKVNSFSKFEGAPPMAADDLDEDMEDDVKEDILVKDLSEKKEKSLDNEENDEKRLAEKKDEESKPKLKLKKIRFVHPMPSFVWKNMKVYGPYDEGDEIDIFPEVAELLIKKGRAEIL
ncbi:MAG: hypothetical protein ABH824_06850 [Nanoarchaeota archaeon]|nr:hypothetical protein [Nanoarchaeota archaeon]MBU1631686.1 hypothetical protein [Nanoarchaeota archaeon]MBU1876252.1 hypothetical protein [Nanoarchaeota archaeon]